MNLHIGHVGMYDYVNACIYIIYIYVCVYIET